MKMTRRGFLVGLLSAVAVGPAILIKKKEAPAQGIDFHRTDFGQITVHHGRLSDYGIKWQETYEQQMKRALKDINLSVNMNLWNGGKLHQ